MLPPIWLNILMPRAWITSAGRHTILRPKAKIERWHQTINKRAPLQNYYLPGDLERHISAFVDHYNRHRYHESLHNLTPADVYHGRGTKILKMIEEIKKQTVRKRRLQHRSAAV